ncbi:TetR/AcrR family transcriptional regulator [Ktedonosporobacter rubrisoli]|nr:TetR/AcrR family transcriptional regulator [Ktedonosporobacter rubrisoli]
MPGETKQHILEAAAKLIEEKGLGRVTTKELSRATGLSEGALYRHFVGKEEVLLAVVAQNLPELQATFQQHLSGTGDLRSDLEAIVLSTMNYFTRIIPLCSAFFSDATLLEQLRAVFQRIQCGPESLYGAVADCIAREQAAGRVNPRVPALNIAIMLLGPCFQQAFMLQLLGRDPLGKSQQQFAQELIQTLMPTLMPEKN